MSLATSLGPAGRTALVTGAGTGIGAAIARALASAGARVALVGRTPESLERTAASITADDGEALVVPCDVTNEAALDQCLKFAESALGPIEILVNNAGVAFSAPLEKTSDEDIDRLMKVNVRAPWSLARRLFPGMAERGFGRIVNIASTAAHRGFRYCTLYTATKHALAGMTRSLAAEGVMKGITANAVCPGYVETPLVERAADVISQKTGRPAEDAKAALALNNPLGRFVTPDEVAAAVLYLVGADSGAINGQSLLLDGGTPPV